MVKKLMKPIVLQGEVGIPLSRVSMMVLRVSITWVLPAHPFSGLPPVTARCRQAKNKVNAFDKTHNVIHKVRSNPKVLWQPGWAAVGRKFEESGVMRSLFLNSTFAAHESRAYLRDASAAVPRQEAIEAAKGGTRSRQRDLSPPPSKAQLNASTVPLVGRCRLRDCLFHRTWKIHPVCGWFYWFSWKYGFSDTAIGAVDLTAIITAATALDRLTGGRTWWQDNLFSLAERVGTSHCSDGIQRLAVARSQC